MYGDNPKYIAEELHRRNKQFDLVWLTHDVAREFPDYIKVRKDSLLNTVYHLATDKVWIDNYRKPYGTLKRKNQLYIQTWHATSLITWGVFYYFYKKINIKKNTRI